MCPKTANISLTATIANRMVSVREEAKAVAMAGLRGTRTQQEPWCCYVRPDQFPWITWKVRYFDVQADRWASKNRRYGGTNDSHKRKGIALFPVWFQSQQIALSTQCRNLFDWVLKLTLLILLTDKTLPSWDPQCMTRIHNFRNALKVRVSLNTCF